jgi:hypothetical protein
MELIVLAVTYLPFQASNIDGCNHVLGHVCFLGDQKLTSLLALVMMTSSELLTPNYKASHWLASLLHVSQHANVHKSIPQRLVSPGEQN